MKNIYKKIKLKKFLSFMQIVWVIIFITSIYKENIIISISSVIFIITFQLNKLMCGFDDNAFELRIEKKEK